jgi:hypothetical protein
VNHFSLSFRPCGHVGGGVVVIGSQVRLSQHLPVTSLASLPSGQESQSRVGQDSLGLQTHLPVLQQASPLTTGPSQLGSILISSWRPHEGNPLVHITPSQLEVVGSQILVQQQPSSTVAVRACPSGQRPSSPLYQARGRVAVDMHLFIPGA